MVTGAPDSPLRGRVSWLGRPGDRHGIGRHLPPGGRLVSSERSRVAFHLAGRGRPGTAERLVHGRLEAGQRLRPREHLAVDQKGRRSRDAGLPGDAHVFLHRRQEALVLERLAESGDIQADGPGVLLQRGWVQRLLIGEQAVVHRPELALLVGGQRRLGGDLGVLVEGHGQVLDDEPDVLGVGDDELGHQRRRARGEGALEVDEHHDGDGRARVALARGVSHLHGALDRFRGPVPGRRASAHHPWSLLGPAGRRCRQRCLRAGPRPSLHRSASRGLARSGMRGPGRRRQTLAGRVFRSARARRRPQRRPGPQPEAQGRRNGHPRRELDCAGDRKHGPDRHGRPGRQGSQRDTPGPPVVAVPHVERGPQIVEPALEPPAHGPGRDPLLAGHLGGRQPLPVAEQHRRPERLFQLRHQLGHQSARLVLGQELLGAGQRRLGLCGEPALPRRPAAQPAPPVAHQITQHLPQPGPRRAHQLGGRLQRRDVGVLKQVVDRGRLDQPRRQPV